MAELGLAAAAVLLAALAVLPGCLGVVKYTHRFLALPRGALFFNVLAMPLWFVSALLLGVAVLMATQSDRALWPMALAVAGFLVISTFGFLMHMRFLFKPVREPRYLSPQQAIERFGEDEEVAGVIDRNGRAFAYIARLARRPHLVYQSEGEAPFLISHCILSHSSMAYELDDRAADSDLYVTSVLANNLVFYDRRRNCTVLQIQNRSRDDSHRLQTLPTLHANLGNWTRFYPDCKVWYRPKEWRDTFYLKLLARASVIDQDSDDLVYPLEHEADPRLPLKAYVMGVRLGDESKAFPASIFGRHQVVEDSVGGEPLVFFSSAGGDLVQLYSRRLRSGQVLSWRVDEAGEFTDTETGAAWSASGECIGGSLEGERLTPVPHYNKIFWCVWADFFPETAVSESRLDDGRLIEPVEREPRTTVQKGA